MKLKTLKLQNYRCFEKFSISFHPQLTAIVGSNGAGKTSILDAASVAIGTFLAGFDNISRLNIPKEDVHHKCFDMGSVLDLQPQYPTVICAEGCISNKVIEWERTLNGSDGRTTIIGAKDIIETAKEYQDKVRNGDKLTILPILCYYGTGRLWDQKRNKKGMNELVRFSRTDGYIDSLDAGSNEKMMLKWFQKMTVQEATKKETSFELQAVKMAIAKCFESASGLEVHEVQFNLDTHGLDVIYSDKQGIKQRSPLNEMSAGYKNTLSMVADIAYRMALLNPQLQGQVLDETPGIILIDEIDQHLHPSWQQRIIADLMSIFPKVQFIVSTHAPAVINSVLRENLLILENRIAVMPASNTYGRDANSILREIMGVPERPDEIKKMFQAFYELLLYSKNLAYIHENWN